MNWGVSKETAGLLTMKPQSHQRMCRVAGVGRPTSVSLDNCYGLSQGVWVFLAFWGIPNSPNSPWVSIRSHGMSWPSMTTGWWLGVKPYENKAKHKVTSYLWLAKGAFCHGEWDKTHFKLYKCCNDGNPIIANLPFTDGLCNPFIVILGMRVSPRQGMNIFLSSHLLASMVRIFKDFWSEPQKAQWYTDEISVARVSLVLPFL